jgi:hypothetical protein
MKNLPVRIDIEAGRFFPVEGAEGDKIGPGPFEGQGGANDFDDVIGGADLFEERWIDEPGHALKAGSRAHFLSSTSSTFFSRARTMLPLAPSALSSGAVGRINTAERNLWVSWPVQERVKISCCTPASVAKKLLPKLSSCF